MTQLQLHIADPVHCVASFENLFIVIWRQPPSEDRIPAIRPFLEAVLERHPEGLGYLVVMEASNPVPKPAARAAGAELFKWMGDRCLFQTVVVESGGIAATLMRAMLRSFAMVSGHQKTFVADDLGKAAEWSAPRLGERFSPASMEAVVRDVRARFAEVAPPLGGKEA